MPWFLSFVFPLLATPFLVVRSCIRKQFLAAAALSLIFIGGLCNFTVMLANGHRMPVTNSSVPFINHPRHFDATVIGGHRMWLADVHGPRSARFSVGDVFVALGLILYVMAPKKRKAN